MKVGVAVILIMLVAGGVTGALYTELWNPSWNPFRPSPQEVLAEMILSMGELNTLHNQTVIEISGLGKSTSLDLKVDSDKSLPLNSKNKGNLKIESSIKESVAADLDFITVSQDYYLKFNDLPDLGIEVDLPVSLDILEGKWILMDQESLMDLMRDYYSALILEVEQNKIIDGLIELIEEEEFYEVKEELPDTKIGDREVYHYALAFSEQGKDQLNENLNKEFSEDFDEFFDRLGQITFEIWVGHKDKYLYRVEFEKEVDISDIREHVSDIVPQDSKKILVSLVMNFSKFNQPVEISAPGGAQTLEEIYQSIIQGFLPEGTSLPFDMSDLQGLMSQ